MVEDNYVPDGWLGALLGVDLYYALWQDDHIRLQFPKIMQAIEEKSAKSSDHECKEGNTIIVYKYHMVRG